MPPAQAPAAAQAAPAAPVAPGVLRITAPNAGPLTHCGTNTYLIGRNGPLALIDPGPDHPGHVATILAAIGGRSLSYILVTHHHPDHIGAAQRVAAGTGAEVVIGRDAAGTPRAGGRPLADGERFAGPGWMIEALATPGHASDHFCFALPGAGLIFSGDHVMGWATSVIVPPDGSVAAYVASLDRVARRPERLYLPGHGDPVVDGPGRAAALKAHRLAREAAIIDALRAGPRDIPSIVGAVYRDLDAALAAAAGQSVLAHLIDLGERGLVTTDRPGSAAALYRRA